MGSVKDETIFPQQQETGREDELEKNHDYELMRAYAEQLNGEFEPEKE